MIFLTSGDVLAVAGRLMKADRPTELVRDLGLLQSAVARPATYAFGVEAYPDLHTKAAALLHSLVRNHPFFDGNKRVGWVSAALFYRANGHDLRAPSVDEGEAFIVEIAAGNYEEVSAIAQVLAAWTEPLGGNRSS